LAARQTSAAERSVAPLTLPILGAEAADWSNVELKGLNVSTHKRAVYEALADMIIQFELPPGERLVEIDLAARLSISKTPVREALAMLDSDGLVEITPYRGAKVRWLSQVEIDEQEFLVDALEEPAYPLVVERITKAEMAQVGNTLEQLKRARRLKDGRSFARLTVEYHNRIFRATGYPRLERLISLVVGPVGLRYDRLLVYQFEDAWDALVALMTARYEALRAGDAARAVEVVRHHRAEIGRLNGPRRRDPEIARYFRE
jgi:DNA-binding GntR family transcriptional regulator